MVPNRFLRDKGEDGWRLFVTGGSFAMGTPYVDQVSRKQDEGGIATWLRRDLGPRAPGPIEVINAAAGAQNSHRVSAIAEEVLNFDPDVVFVATCNNEGALPPGRVREQLHKLGGYRLLGRHLAPTPRPRSAATTPPRTRTRPRSRARFGPTPSVRSRWPAPGPSPSCWRRCP
ncbi:MAG: hypothetical protein GY898_01080 [Proteobacteria bacterium]|nr:hypothetical protein [Pseudomonadota bacterium]